MTKKLRVAGIDPSLNNTGLALGEYDIETGNLTISRIELIETENQAGKKVRKNSDDLRRAFDIISRIHEWIRECHVVFAEVPTGSQSARGSFSNGICVGVLGSIGAVQNDFKGRLIQVLPNEVKMRACGSKVASKEEMIEWAHERWPKLEWAIYRGALQRKNEHMADACAAINAGIETDEFKNLVQALSMFR